MKRDSPLLRLVGPRDGGLVWFLIKQFLFPFWFRAGLVLCAWGCVLVLRERALVLFGFRLNYMHTSYPGLSSTPLRYEVFGPVMVIWSIVFATAFCVICASPHKFLGNLKTHAMAQDIFLTPLSSREFTRSFSGVLRHSLFFMFFAQAAIFMDLFVLDLFISTYGFGIHVPGLLFYLVCPSIAFFWVLFWSMTLGRIWIFIPIALAGMMFTHDMLARGTDETTLLYWYTGAYALVTLAIMITGLIKSKISVATPFAFGLTGMYVAMAHLTPRLRLPLDTFVVLWSAACLVLGTVFYFYLRKNYVARATRLLFP